MSESHDDPLSDLAAEQAVLGAILLWPDTLGEVDAIVVSTDFLDPRHEVLYDALKAIREQPDAVTEHGSVNSAVLTRHLRSIERFNTVGGSQYLSEITDATPTAAHARVHAQGIAELAARRRIRDEHLRGARSAADPSIPVDVLVERAAEDLRRAAVGGAPRNTLVGVGHALDHVEERRQQGVMRRGYPLPWPTVDTTVRGLRRGATYVIAGLTSMGKSTFLRNLATALAAPKVWFPQGSSDSARGAVPVIVFTLEMPSEDNAVQVAASIVGCSGDAIERGVLEDSERQRLVEARNTLDGAPLVFDAETEHPERMAAIVRRFKRDFGDCVVAVDYLQLCDPAGLAEEKNPTRERQVGAMSRFFKRRIALALDVPVVLLSQFNRSADGEDGQKAKKPRLKDLRESGAIEQDADVVMFLWGERPKGHDVFQDVTCTIAKVRGGAANVDVPLRLHRRSTRFSEIDGGVGGADGFPAIDSPPNYQEPNHDHEWEAS